MTQEQKQLLLKDLCARLPYGVIVDYPNARHKDWSNAIACIDRYPDTVYTFLWGRKHKIEDVKPYLRPMSSMTEEEINEFTQIDDALLTDNPNVDFYFYCANIEQIDWLNAHHFDYRGLIEKGLALEAKPGMYETDEI